MISYIFPTNDDFCANCEPYGDAWSFDFSYADLIGCERDLLPYWQKVFYTSDYHRANVVATDKTGSKVYSVTECPVCGVEHGCYIYRNMSVCTDCLTAMCLTDFLIKEFGKSKKAAIRQATRGIVHDSTETFALAVGLM